MYRGGFRSIVECVLVGGRGATLAIGLCVPWLSWVFVSHLFFGLQRVGAKKKAHLSRKTKPNKCVCLEGVDFGYVGSTFHMLLSTKPCTAKMVLQCGYWSCRGTSEESKTSNMDHHSNEKLKQFLAENQDQISPT